MQINGSQSTIYNINVDGINYSNIVTEYQGTPMGQFRLFALASPQYLSNGLRIYSAKLTIDRTLVRNFIPARRNSDNKYGMYDTVTGTFFTNAATSGDDFTAGPEISNMVYVPQNQ